MIEKELGVELVGDVKVKIQADDDEDPLGEIVEDNPVDTEKVEDKTIDEINENYLDETV